jgi:crossover junction endodeoxyribonuclease RuvC
MIIIGIDPGIADTGWGVIDYNGGSRLQYLACGSIKTPAGLILPDRLLMLSEALEAILQRYQPQAAGMEELFFCNNVKTALVVGQARGVSLLTLRRFGLPVFDYTPLQVKQAVAAYGAADKKQVQRMVKTILSLSEVPKPDDAADALAVAICASQDAFNQSRQYSS